MIWWFKSSPQGDVQYADKKLWTIISSFGVMSKNMLANVMLLTKFLPISKYETLFCVSILSLCLVFTYRTQSKRTWHKERPKLQSMFHICLYTTLCDVFKKSISCNVSKNLIAQLPIYSQPHILSTIPPRIDKKFVVNLLDFPQIDNSKRLFLCKNGQFCMSVCIWWTPWPIFDIHIHLEMYWRVNQIDLRHIFIELPPTEVSNATKSNSRVFWF